MRKNLDYKIKNIKQYDSNEIMKLFEEVYNEYYKLVCYILSKYISNEKDIEELANDTFLNFFNNMKKIESSIKYYLVVSARNSAMNFLNKQSRENNYLLNSEFIDQMSSKPLNQNYSRILSFLKEYLSNEEIVIIEEHLIYEKKFKVIAEERKMNVNSVKTLYYRAIQKVGEINE